MSLASARLLMRAATATRTHAAERATRLGLAATYTRPLYNSLIPTRRGFASVSAPSSTPADASAPAALSSASALLPTLYSRLNACVKAQQPAEAERLIRAFEAQGGRCDLTMLKRWIGCSERAGDWKGAERVWARFGEFALNPDRFSYRTLIQVYTCAGGDQLAKIDPLLSEMQQNGVELVVKDYEQLIKRAHGSKLPAEVRRWSEAARAAGLFDLLDELSRHLTALSVNPRLASLSPRAAADYAVVMLQLRSAMQEFDFSAASQFIDAFEQRGGKCDRAMLNMWLECCKRASDWKGMERAWARFGELKLQPNSFRYSALMQVYTIAGGEQLAKIDPLLSEMHAAGLRLSVTDYKLLILRSGHRVPELRYWLTAAHAAGVFDQRTMLANRQRDEQAAAQLWKDPSDEYERESSFGSSKALAGLISKAQPAQIEAIVAECDRLRIALDPSALTTWLSSYRHGSNWQAAESVWARFGELHVQPNRENYTALLRVYTQAGGEQLAKIDSLQSEMQQLNVRLSFHDYDDLIRAADQSKLPAQVRRWSEAARAAGLFDLLDRASRNIVTQSSSSLSQSDALADAPAASHSSASLAALPAAVDNSAVISQLRIALKMHDAAAAQRSISEFEQRGGKCDIAMLTQWISCHQKGGDWQAAERVWTRFGELGLKPNNVSYRALMQVYTLAGGDQLAKIDPLLSEMQQNGVELVVKDYEQLIKRAHGSKLPAEVRRWSEAARAAGMFDQLDELSRTLLSSSVNRAPASVHSSVDSASSSVASPISAILSVESRLRTAFSEGELDVAAMFIAALVARGWKCSVSTLNQWISCHEKSGDWQVAERVWARFGELGLKPNNVSYRALLRVYTAAGGDQLAKIDALLSEMQQNGIQFSAKDYEQLIKAAHRCKLPAEVRRWSALARAACVFEELDEASRSIVAHPANRPPSSAAVDARSGVASASSSASSLTGHADTTGSAAAAIEPSAELCSALGNHSDSSELWRLLSAFERDGGRITPFMYSQWLQCFLSETDWQGAERAWALLHERSVHLDRRCFVAMLQIYTRAGGDYLLKIDPLLSEMRSRSLKLTAQDYEMLISMAVTLQLPAQVKRWAERAHASGLLAQLSPTTLRRVDNTLPDANQSSAASVVTDACLSSVTSPPAASSMSLLTAAEYTAITSQLNSAMKSGDATSASRIIDAFEQRGGRYTVALLNQWISCHGRTNWQGAEPAWTRFGELGLKPDSNSYRALIEVYTRPGGAHLDKIDSLLSEMHLSGLSFTAADYEKLIKTAEARSREIEVGRWIAAARAAGVFDQLDLPSRFSKFVKRQLEEEAALQRWMQLTDEQKRADSLGPSHALAVLAFTAQPAPAEAIVADCDRLGIALSVPALTSWIRCHRPDGNWRAAERAWARIRERQHKPDGESYRALPSLHKRWKRAACEDRSTSLRDATHCHSLRRQRLQRLDQIR